MRCTSENIHSLLEKYCFFYDSVILVFNIMFTDSVRNIKVDVKCRDSDKNEVILELLFKNVTAWKFSGCEKEAPEVVTEGFRFKYDDGWSIDFGDDPDILLTDADWRDFSTKYITAEDCFLSEIRP